jgi:DivIVA domain-containing protein
MASDPRLSPSDTSLSADLIAQRGFTSSRRGFDPDEVRAFLGKVAQEFRAMRQRQATLEEQVREAEYRAAHPVWDENAILSAVGEETASILRSAHAAAADIKTKAEDNAGRILRAAHEQSEGMRAEAEVVLKQRTDEADVAASRVRELASADAERMRDAARQQAEAIRAQVEAERKAVVEAAQTTRERILADLSRRRNVAAVQIDQLRAGRERLLEAYRVVRDTLDEVTDELQRADAEARAAALAAGRRADAGEPAEAGASVDRAATAAHGPEQAPAHGSDSGPGSEGAGSEGAGSEGGPGPVPASGLEAATVERGSGQQGPPRPLGPSGAGSGSEPVDEATAGPGGPTADLDETGPGAQVGHPAFPPGGGGGAAPGASGGRAPAMLLEAADRPAEQAESPDVDSLFARIRADREEAVARARDVLSGTGPESGSGSNGEAAGEAAQDDRAGSDDAAGSDEDELARQRRDEAVETIEAGLARRLKRVLQDEQNDLLDQLRNVRGHPTAAQVLPARDAHAERFAAAGRPLLDQAARAGAEFVRTSLPQPAPAGCGELPELDDLAADLAVAIVDPLRRRLEEVFADSRGDDATELAESVGAAYREWKTQRIELTASDHVASAFARGAFAATPNDAVLRWVVDDVDGPCPDCDDNTLAGELPRGEAFPTGQPHPPAHAGCRCLLVPRRP